MSPAAARRWVLLAAAILFLWSLGGHDLWAPEEPKYGEIAREMVVDGQWAVPHVNGRVYSDKPPLLFWLIAIASLPFGAVTPFAARLPSVLAALGVVALVVRIGSRRWGPWTGALAGAVLATTYLFWEKARWAQTDALLCLWIWVALAAFDAFRSGEADGRRAGLLFWLAAALAVLTKGPVGLLLPLGIALVVLAIDRELGRWRRFAPLAGPLAFVAVVGAWVLAASWLGPEGYTVWGALREHFVERAIEGRHHVQPPWYFLEVLPPLLLPWTALVPGALVLAWRRRLPADRLALVAALFVLVFFSVSTEKRELYALPAVPAFALMVAALVGRVAGWREPAGGRSVALDRRWVTLAQALLGGLVALAGAALPLLARRRAEELPSWVAVALATILVATGTATLVASLRGRVRASALLPMAGLAVAYLFVATAVYPRFEGRKSARAFSQVLREQTAGSRAAGHPVLAYRLGNLPEAFAYFSDGVSTVETDDPARVAAHLGAAEPVFAALDARRLEALPAETRAALFVVADEVVSGERVLLLTNRATPGARPLAAPSP
ncbi:MAG TPA: glycosyltransferase family 39 protein [Thermoanaerobaculia bacterium]|nr:glycosyltransferase family 39 protein [Thermoanaerobaculia bacterium]